MPRSFFGGVHPRGYKELSCNAPLIPFRPKTVAIAMSQHIGAPCKPLVSVGQHVLLGQKIGDGTGLCVPVHASVSGTVVAVEALPHPGGTNVMSVLIESDGRNDLAPGIQPRESIGDLDAQALIEIIHQAGITGMGGAGFPTHVKLSSGLGKVDTVIVNGAECEPYITADDRLMRETPERVAGGLRIIRKILQPERTAIGIEANKPQSIEAMRGALDADVELLALRVRYPQGAEKQLIQSVTGRCVPPGGLPAAVGCAVFNAATCAAIYDAVYEGMPLVRRAVTVTGQAIARPSNFLAPIGTRFDELIEAAGGFACAPYKILSGGPMMGGRRLRHRPCPNKGVCAAALPCRVSFGGGHLGGRRCRCGLHLHAQRLSCGLRFGGDRARQARADRKTDGAVRFRLRPHSARGEEKACSGRRRQSASLFSCRCAGEAGNGARRAGQDGLRRSVYEISQEPGVLRLRRMARHMENGRRRRVDESDGQSDPLPSSSIRNPRSPGKSSSAVMA